MPRKRHTPEQTIRKLREAEVEPAKGQTTVDAVRKLGITEQTYYRWRKEYGGLRMDGVDPVSWIPHHLGRGDSRNRVNSSSQPREFEGMGIDFEKRREIFDEHLRVLRKRWSSAAAGEVGGTAAGSANAVVAAFAHVAGSDEEARKTAAPALGRLIQSMVGTAPPNPEDLYDSMRERGSGLFGGAEHVAKQLDRYAEIGVGHMAFVTRFGGMDAAAAEQSLRRLAPGS